MMVSPAERCFARDAIVKSVTPAGTITQIVRGVGIFAAKSAKSAAPIKPSEASAFTASGLTS